MAPSSGGQAERVGVTTVDAALRRATSALESAGVPSPAVDAEHLLAHVRGTDRARLARARLLGDRLSAAEHHAYLEIVQLRCLRLPLQHLTGAVDFAGLRLRVGPGVFVPRPETELLTERAHALLQGCEQPLVVDLCSGSGAIALAVLHRSPSATVYAVELSERAAAWARVNIEATGLDVRLRQEAAQHCCEDLLGTVDLVTCNPPYIPHDAVPVEPEVAEHDPEVALYSPGIDGTDLPVTMAARAAGLLRPGGHLLMEHGQDQRRALIAAIASDGTWSDVTGYADLGGRPRFIEATRAGSS